MDLSSLITMVTIVFSKFKITRGLKIFLETGPRSHKGHYAGLCQARALSTAQVRGPESSFHEALPNPRSDSHI